MLILRGLAVCAGLASLAACTAPPTSGGGSTHSDVRWDSKADGQGVYRTLYRIDQGYAAIEVLDDDLIHVEFGTGAGPRDGEPIYASTMVHRSDYTGPEQLRHDGEVLETGAIHTRIDRYGCIEAKKTDGTYLTKVCPVALAQDWSGFSIEPSAMRNVYGLGQYFRNRGTADGDWTSFGRFRTDGDYGTNFRDFWGGASAQIQFPIMYALGDSGNAFGLFFDNVYKQDWDFASDSWWQVRGFGDTRFYIMAGDDLTDIRADYMELTGRPPVPPRKAFGLWVSEFGYDNWGEIDHELGVLRERQYPIDGFVLDLQWFGGAWENSDDSPMGGLRWDEQNFPDPRNKIRSYAQDNVGLITIEESYVSRNQPSYGQMRQREGLAHVCNTNNDVEFWNWMGHTGMIDWSSSESAAWWHDNMRRPNIVDMGILGHWTDLGEPERYDANACYRGVEPNRYRHGDIHNIYNLLWHKSIYEGYVRNQTRQRPFLMSRAGAPGIQRFGAAMWSGDIASRLDVLATHQNVAMQMSFAGVDYYGADVGGFWRRAMWDDSAVTDRSQFSVDEMYTQWFANAAWFDVPLRPHTFNCGFSWFHEPSCPHETNPAEIGYRPSNLANLRQRYELIPYYYSLAHRAYEHGEPLIAPMVMYYPDDPEVRRMGHERLIGRDILVGVVASHGERQRNMYLPAGTWVDWFTGQFIESSGQWINNVPAWRGDAFRLPVFARAGAIIPMMQVDDRTADAYGHRRDGSINSDLVATIFAAGSTEFTLYEDDGATVDYYDESQVPQYDVRRTLLSQHTDAGSITVDVGAAEGTYDGAIGERNIELRVRVPSGGVRDVRVDGVSLGAMTDDATLRGSARGWFADGGFIRVRTGVRPVGTATQVVIAR